VPKSIGIISQTYAQPLFNGLKQRDDLFHLVEDFPTQLAIKLREKKLDGAFLSPIDYAKDYSMYRIIPEVGVVSQGESNTIFLFFRENIRKFETLAFDPNFSSEIVLASIVLSEKFSIKPKLIPFIGDITNAFQKVDALLVVGDEAIKLKENKNKIDLVDEWNDITELPFVHGIWVARESNLNEEERETLISAGNDMVMKNIPDNYKNVSYQLDDFAVEALTEFFRMAYYHGILKDIPDVKFF
jgi:predicted solute-binding protein